MYLNHNFFLYVAKKKKFCKCMNIRALIIIFYDDNPIVIYSSNIIIVIIIIIIAITIIIIIHIIESFRAIYYIYLCITNEISYLYYCYNMLIVNTRARPIEKMCLYFIYYINYNYRRRCSKMTQQVEKCNFEKDIKILRKKICNI